MKPTGVILFIIFTTQSVFADMTCDTNINKYYAKYTINTYTCSAGQYLPANTLGCVACLADFNCPGGTFDFNPDYFQGLNFNHAPSTQMNNVCAGNFPPRLVATYTPNSHTCSVGYYLPANVDACTQCPSGSACVGGTYSFNETFDQGIVTCNGTYSPTGSAVCYQHILHVGNDVIYLRSEKLTTPSLNIKIGNDTFYANMTTTSTYMNKDSTHYLHIQYADTDYYVCDDTTYPH